MADQPTHPNFHYPLDEKWLAQRTEAALEPERPIIDPHHHLWDRQERYLFDELLADTRSGHNILATVYLQCASMYRADGDRAYASLGETEFVNGVAAMSASGFYGKMRACAGIVGHADLLRLGDGVAPVLEAHIRVAGGRFRGIRNSTVWDADPTIITVPIPPPKGMLGDAQFRAGFAHLARHQLSFDAWLYFTQLGELAALARAFPDTTIVIDHVGAPIGIGVYKGKRAEVFETWRTAIRDIARCPNVVVKLGGLGMYCMGFGFEEKPVPPTSEELAAAWRPYLETCIEAFGPDRAMFESNFPVDKQSCPYVVLWNAFKRFAAAYSEAEKHALFVTTAARIYRLGEVAGVLP